jgi:hypothetical protein
MANSRSFQVRFELDEIDDEFLAGAGACIVERDHLGWGFGAEDDAVEVDLAEIVVVAFAA